MKIRAYPFMHQEGRAPRTGEQKEAVPASRRSLPLPKEDESVKENRLSETMGARVRAYLAQVHSAQEELSSLHREEERLAEAEKLNRQVGELLKQQDEGGSREKIDQLYRHLGKVRELLTKLIPGFTKEGLSPLPVSPEAAEQDISTIPRPQLDLEKELGDYNAKLEEQRLKLTARQKELIAAIAHSLVAVENIAASSSVIRDEDYARQVMTDVKEKLAEDQQALPLFEANRQKIAALLQ